MAARYPSQRTPVLHPLRQRDIIGGMETERNTKSSGAVVLCILAFLVLLPVLYVLSIGPVALLYRTTSAPPFVVAIYIPLLYVAETWDAFGDVLQWYIDLWTK